MASGLFMVIVGIALACVGLVLWKLGKTVDS